MGILPKESRVVLEKEDNNDESMAEGGDRGDEGVWIDEEDAPPEDLRYNRDGKKNYCITQEHAEDSF